MLKSRLLMTFGLGVGSALVAMAIFPLVAGRGKPIMKGIIRGGLNLTGQMKQAYAEGKEKFEDIVAEVKEEMEEKE